MADHPESIHIMLVEDNPADADLCIRALRKRFGAWIGREAKLVALCV
jgi:hypothetical protein